MKYIFNYLPYAALVSVSLVYAPVSQAWEVRYGNGDFAMHTQMSPWVSLRTQMDVQTWTLAEPHHNWGNSRFYYSVRADYFDSASVNRLTDLFSLPLTTPVTLINSSISDVIADNTLLPVPADYRLHGINVDAGLGYDLIKTPRAQLGVGVTTGMSTPFMKVRNMQSNANFVLDMLDTFDTKVETYKAGVQLTGQYHFTPWLTLQGDAALAHQTGKMRNNIVASDVDMDGTYRTVELAAKLKPTALWHQPRLKNAFISLGHTHTQWDYDQAALNTPLGSISVPSMFDGDAQHNSTYLSIGYDF